MGTRAETQKLIENVQNWLKVMKPTGNPFVVRYVLSNEVHEIDLNGMSEKDIEDHILNQS